MRMTAQQLRDGLQDFISRGQGKLRLVLAKEDRGGDTLRISEISEGVYVLDIHGIGLVWCIEETGGAPAIVLSPEA